MLLLKNVAYTIVVPSTLAIYLPWLLVSEQTTRTGVWLFISLALFLLGGAGYLWCLWSFATVGQGTPAPFDAPTKLVVRGLYHHIRNPMYGSILTLLCGWIALFPSLPLLLYVLSVGFCIHLFVLLYEEPHLQKIFGDSYDNYRRQVSRWVPSIRKER